MTTRHSSHHQENRLMKTSGRRQSAQVLLVLTAALAGCGSSAPPAETQATPVAGITGAADMLAKLPLLDPSVFTHQASSHAQNGSNLDFANTIRTDPQGRFVLMEAAGPGAITRIWLTPLNLLGARGDP